MESSAEVLQPTPDFIECPSDGFQPVSGPYKVWNQEMSAELGEKSLFTTECPKCHTTKRVFEQISIPQTNVNLTIPKGWLYQVETPTAGKVAEMTACSLGKPNGSYSEEKGAYLKIKTFDSEKKELKLPWQELPEKIKIADQQVTSYKMENPEDETTDIIAQFNRQGKAYQMRMTYNPDIYPNGEKSFSTILRSFQFPTT